MTEIHPNDPPEGVGPTATTEDPLVDLAEDQTDVPDSEQFPTAEVVDGPRESEDR